jgi:hypothetical protein
MRSWPDLAMALISSLLIHLIGVWMDPPVRLLGEPALRGDVRSWPLADIPCRGCNVRFLGVKQTCRLGQGMSASDPRRKSRAVASGPAVVPPI